jgi:choline-sulfatase
MLTGLHPWTAGVIRTTDKIPLEVTTVAETLLKNNYETKAITNGEYVSKQFGMDQGFQTFELILNDSKQFHLIAEKALSWMDIKRRHPFFLFLHSYDAHTPYTPSEESFHQVHGSGTPLKLTTKEASLLKISGKTPDVFESNQLKAAYEGGIRDLDEKLGFFLNEMNKRNLLQNTIVIITSDHGEEMGEHGTWAQHTFTLFNEVLHIPLLVYVPHTPAKKIRALVGLVDVAPTILDLLGIEKNPMDGLPLPVSDDVSFDRSLYAIGTMARGVTPKIAGSSEQKTITSSEWAKFGHHEDLKIMTMNSSNKMIINITEGTQNLYDLKKDPLEKNPQTVACQDVLCTFQNSLIMKSRLIK